MSQLGLETYFSAIRLKTRCGNVTIHQELLPSSIGVIEEENSTGRVCSAIILSYIGKIYFGFNLIYQTAFLAFKYTSVLLVNSACKTGIGGLGLPKLSVIIGIEESELN